MKTVFPYELHTSGGGFCVLFETAAEALALPLTALVCARLRTGGEGQQLVLEFNTLCVRIDGTGLTEMLAHLLVRRVKTIRVGHHEICVVKKLYIY